MKKILILIIFVCFLKNTKAQEYPDFPVENARWVYSNSYRESENFQTYYLFYYQHNDTVINNLNYKIINRKYWYQKFNSNEILFISPIENYCFLREEDKKIYFKFFSQEKEYLAFDFNLLVNDTFVTFNNDTLIVIEEFQKYNRKALRFEILNADHFANQFFEEWVEGIGNINSFFLTANDFFYNLNCFKEEDCDTCSCFDEIITSNIPIQAPHIINISPNPATDFIRLELEDENNSIQILNSQGQVVYQEKTSDKILNIQTQNFASGLYFVIVTHHNGNVSKGKFVKL